MLVALVMSASVQLARWIGYVYFIRRKRPKEIRRGMLMTILAQVSETTCGGGPLCRGRSLVRAVSALKILLGYVWIVSLGADFW